MSVCNYPVKEEFNRFILYDNTVKYDIYEQI